MSPDAPQPYGSPITLEAAKKAAAPALAEAARNNWAMAVAVVDIAGDLFYSGVLLFADTDLAAPRKTPRETRRIFHRPYGSSPAVAHSVFVVREPVDWAPAVFQRCERAVDAVRPAERTIERMREAIERSL